MENMENMENMDNQVVADHEVGEVDEGVKSKFYNDAITIITATMMVALVFLFTIGILIRRKRKSKVAPVPKSLKNLEDPSTDFNPSQKHYNPSYQYSNFLSSKFSYDHIMYPDKSYSGGTKEIFRSSSYLDDYLDGNPYLSNSHSESYPLQKHEDYIQIKTDPKLSDIPPSLGEIPNLRTESDTWEKYLGMMSVPGKLNEAVDYMRRTGNSPHAIRA